MSEGQTLRGVATISLWAEDLEAAKRWYTELLGVEPYFQRPGYCEFRVGDYQHEIGLIDSKYAPGGRPGGPGGAVVYWHVDDVEDTVERLLSLGAAEYEPVTERGPGVRHRLRGRPVREHPGRDVQRHYLEVLAWRKP